MSQTLCFVCSRCEHPVCSREDLLLAPVACGTTANAFVYELEDLLNVEAAVPCYSGDEVAEVRALVSEKILTAALPPAARLLALEAVVESQRTLQREELEDQEEAQRNADEKVSRRGLGEAVDPSSTTSSPGDLSVEVGDVHPHHHHTVLNPSPTELSTTVSLNTNTTTTTNSTTTTGPSSLTGRLLAGARRVKESRVDLVCVREEVLMGGLVRCSRDRSSGPPPPPAVPLAGAGAGDGEASQRPPAPTRWSSHPGNLDVEEAFIQVRRRTKTARCPWFEAYDCTDRLECPDCHLGLGYLFVRNSRKSTVSESTSEEEIHIMCDVKSDGRNIEGFHEPHQKKERKEEEGRCDDNNNSNNSNNQQQQDSEDNASQYPNIFVGLELKNIRQREWGLRDFQKRYQQAKDLKGFRELFPEAEELESLYGRLTALRTQSELYNNLLRKHKEQNDVQTALIQSQKERIYTYEEKLRTMQQIIEAQRAQLEMQGRQIKHQEELVKNHKSQVVTQQQQIHVEQLLLSEQTRTIESQREQINLIQAHLRARLRKEDLEERCGQLTTLLHRAEEQRQAQASATAAAAASLQRSCFPTLPPPHLMGITGRDTRDDNITPTEEDSDHKDTNSQPSQINRNCTVLSSLQMTQHNNSSNIISNVNVNQNERRGVDIGVKNQRWIPSNSSSSFLTSSTSMEIRPSIVNDVSTSQRTAEIMRRFTEDRISRNNSSGVSIPLSTSTNSTSRAKSAMTEEEIQTTNNAHSTGGSRSNYSPTSTNNNNNVNSNSTYFHPSGKEE